MSLFLLALLEFSWLIYLQFPQYALEWAIPSENTEECLSEMKVWLDKEAADPKGLRAHFPIEIRWSCADEIWLSPSQGKETCWIGLVTFRYISLSSNLRIPEPH